MGNSEKISKVISLINFELDNNCNVEVYPKVCVMKDDVRQRNQIIRSVVMMIAKNKGMTIDGAIAQLESEYESLNQ